MSAGRHHTALEGYLTQPNPTEEMAKQVISGNQPPAIQNLARFATETHWTHLSSVINEQKGIDNNAHWNWRFWLVSQQYRGKQLSPGENRLLRYTRELIEEATANNLDPHKQQKMGEFALNTLATPAPAWCLQLLNTLPLLQVIPLQQLFDRLQNGHHYLYMNNPMLAVPLVEMQSQTQLLLQKRRPNRYYNTSDSARMFDREKSDSIASALEKMENNRDKLRWITYAILSDIESFSLNLHLLTLPKELIATKCWANELLTLMTHSEQSSTSDERESLTLLLLRSKKHGKAHHTIHVNAAMLHLIEHGAAPTDPLEIESLTILLALARITNNDLMADAITQKYPFISNGDEAHYDNMQAINAYVTHYKESYEDSRKWDNENTIWAPYFDLNNKLLCQNPDTAIKLAKEIIDESFFLKQTQFPDPLSRLKEIITPYERYPDHLPAKIVRAIIDLVEGKKNTFTVKLLLCNTDDNRNALKTIYTQATQLKRTCEHFGTACKISQARHQLFYAMLEGCGLTLTPPVNFSVVKRAIQTCEDDTVLGQIISFLNLNKDMDIFKDPARDMLFRSRTSQAFSDINEAINLAEKRKEKPRSRDGDHPRKDSPAAGTSSAGGSEHAPGDNNIEMHELVAPACPAASATNDTSNASSSGASSSGASSSGASSSGAAPKMSALLEETYNQLEVEFVYKDPTQSIRLVGRIISLLAQTHRDNDFDILRFLKNIFSPYVLNQSHLPGQIIQGILDLIAGKENKFIVHLAQSDEAANREMLRCMYASVSTLRSDNSHLHFYCEMRQARHKLFYALLKSSGLSFSQPKDFNNLFPIESAIERCEDDNVLSSLIIVLKQNENEPIFTDTVNKGKCSSKISTTVSHIQAVLTLATARVTALHARLRPMLGSSAAFHSPAADRKGVKGVKEVKEVKGKPRALPGSNDGL
jgi:hypothetical protein